MPIADLLSPRVVSVRPDETVRVAIARMLEENVGSVAVCEDERLVGIFTERDVLVLAGDGADFEALLVRDVMTRALVTVTPDVDVLTRRASWARGRSAISQCCTGSTCSAWSGSARSCAACSSNSGYGPIPTCGRPRASSSSGATRISDLNGLRKTSVIPV